MRGSQLRVDLTVRHAAGDDHTVGDVLLQVEDVVEVSTPTDLHIMVGEPESWSFASEANISGQLVTRLEV